MGIVYFVIEVLDVLKRPHQTAVPQEDDPGCIVGHSCALQSGSLLSRAFPIVEIASEIICQLCHPIVGITSGDYRATKVSVTQNPMHFHNSRGPTLQ